MRYSARMMVSNKRNTKQETDTMNWIIENRKDRELAWSESWGWCTETFDTFTCYEKETVDLPIDGEWQSVSWEVEGD